MTRLAYLSTDPGVAYGGTKGAAVHVAEVTRALAAAGADVLLVACSVAVGAPEPPHGVTLELLPGPGKRSTADERLDGRAAAHRVARRAPRRFGADALYERLGLHSAAGAEAARALGIPHLVELNAPLPEEAARYRRLDRAADAERLERAVLAGADVVFAVSAPLAAYAPARGARRVEVLPNAVALERFAPARHDGGGPPDRRLRRARCGHGTAPRRSPRRGRCSAATRRTCSSSATATAASCSRRPART